MLRMTPKQAALNDIITQSPLSANVRFDGPVEHNVLFRVDSTHADYFKRKKFYPTQEIVEEKADGTLIASYNVGYYEAVRHIIKSWIPFVTVLEPDELRVELLNDVALWTKKQKSINKC
jgi:hypothetical protein